MQSVIFCCCFFFAVGTMPMSVGGAASLQNQEAKGKEREGKSRQNKTASLMEGRRHVLLLKKAQMDVAEVNRRAVTWKAAVVEDFSFLDESEKRFYVRQEEDNSRGHLPDVPHQFGGTDGYEIVPKPLDEQEPELEYVGQVDSLTYKPIVDSGGLGDDGTNSSTPPSPTTAVTCTDYRFDIRKKWPQCAEIMHESEIRDQSKCSSCYAVAGAAAFTDRHCITIAKRGWPKSLADQDRFYFSAADIMQCSNAADDQDACTGGWSNKVWRFLNEHGVVSGNGYNQGGCKPYPFPPKNGTTASNEFKLARQCEERCPNAGYGHQYRDDKEKTSNWHTLGKLNGNGQMTGPTSWEQVIKEEIYANGTVPVDMLVYDDFLSHYTGGIYHQVSNALGNGHVVRLIGYGRVNCSNGQSTKYWLGANSWNTNWGEQGFFRIRRGTDEVGIESRDISFGAIKLSDR